MQEIYAQVGIKVLIVDDNGAEIASVGIAQIKDPPTGVDLTTVGKEGLDEFPVAPDANGKIQMTAEEKALGK